MGNLLGKLIGVTAVQITAVRLTHTFMIGVVKILDNQIQAGILGQEGRLVIYMAQDFSMFPDLHDVHIFGIEHNITQKALFLRLVFPDSRKSTLSFPSVFGWRLTSFDEQNIIYRTDIYKGSRLLEDIESDEPIHDGHLQWAIEEQGVIFNIDSVTGIRGYIVSKDLGFVS